MLNIRYTYLLVDLGAFVVPFLFSFHPKIRFYKKFIAFFPANFLMAFCFLVWDAFFTKAGVWGFHDQYTLGYKVFNLPVEEVLFFICIPFSCVFTYHCLASFYDLRWKHSTERNFVLVLSAGLILCGFVFNKNAYTVSTFISTGVLLLLLKFVFKVRWLSKFFSVYAILLIPFLIVNGILTGTGLEQPVVWYNDKENLGIRILTIPVEDVFYGMEMTLLNLFFYERLKNHFTRNEKKLSPQMALT